MNYKELKETFDTIAAAKGNAKHPLIIAALKKPDFIRTIQYMFDTRKTFNVSKVPYSVPPLTEGQEELFTFLNYLNAKGSANKKDKEILSKIASKSPDKYEIVSKILSRKSHAGFTNDTINKLAPGLIPYFPYMRCKGIAHLDKIKFPCFSQVKADGMYHEVVSGNYRTRNGNPLDFSLVPNTINLPGTFMGEVTMVEEDGITVMNRRDSNAIVNKAQRSELSQEEANRIRFVYWDIKSEKLEGATYINRFNLLGRYKVPLIECKVVNNMEEAWDHYDDVRSRGLEGTILKNLDGLWRDGDSPDQIKLKANLTTELYVYGIVPGKAGHKYEGMIGSLKCKSSCGMVDTDVGMGLSDADRAKEDWEGSIVEIKFNEVSKSKVKDTYALSHARLVERRTDKTEADDLQYILNLKEAKRK
jgi:DNA ligase-1